MMKRKIVCLVLLFIMIITIINITVQATDSTYSGARSVTQFDDIGDDTTTSETMASWLGSALVIVQVVGSGVAIIMLVVIAIKYITSAPSDKASIKKQAVVYVIGAIVLFATSAILGIIREFSTNNIKIE